MGFLAGWMLNPWLFAAGGLLVAAPILIHLLNRRKFRVVDWAAMDFLLEADQRNRRRVQIEELILLLLRCAAMMLAGLFVSRPFLPSSITRSLFQADRTERVVLLDDSPSMDAAHAGSTPFRTAKRRVAEFVTALATQGGGDSLTLCLTSRPDRPIMRDVVVDNRSAAGLVGEVEALMASHLPARLDRAFVSLRGLVQGKSERINRVGYVLSDLRRSDWASEMTAGDEKSGKKDRVDEAPVAEALTALSKDLAGCFVVDCGDGPVTNVAVSDISPEDKALLSGVTTRFQVTVKNLGSETLREVPVKFVAGGSLPIMATIHSIPAGGRGSAPFSFTFAATAGDDDAVDPVEMTAEVGSVPGDMLAADNQRFYAARVRAGIPTLIVDGDPSAEFGHAESFFLQRALAPPGTTRSGITTEVVTDDDFGAASLDGVQAVYLCNVYQLDEARLKSLEEWVRAGGGLVVFTGGQVDQRFYNDVLFRGGKGLLPRPLQSISGDETEMTWATFAVVQPEHPAVKMFGGDAAPLLESAKFYQWWSVPEDGEGNVLLRLTDAERSPALIERRFGPGRVVQFNVPADAEWSNWPEDASYLILLQELNRYLAQTTASPGQITAGEPLSEPVDLSRFRAEVGFVRPGGATSTLIATSSETNEGKASTSQWGVRIDDATTVGFYRFDLSTPEGQTQKVLSAANLHPGESDLGRMDAKALQSSWQGAAVELVGSVALAGLTADAARGELWLVVLLILATVLFAEQGLAWAFGRRRSMNQSPARNGAVSTISRYAVAAALGMCISAAANAQEPAKQRLVLPEAETPVIRRVPAIAPRGLVRDEDVERPAPAAPVPQRRLGIFIKGELAALPADQRQVNPPLDAALNTSEELERLLERAIGVSAERPDLAPVLWQRIFDEGANAFARASVKNAVAPRRPYEIYRPFSNESLSALIAAGPEAILHYRLHSDGPAQALMVRQGADREAALAEVARRYFLTTVGDEAAFELGCRLLERGDFISADQVFDRLSLYPDSNIAADAISVRRAVAQSRLGRMEIAIGRVEAIGKEFENVKPLLLLDFNGQKSAAAPAVAAGEHLSASFQPANASELEPQWEFRPQWTLKGVKATANNQAIMSGTGANGRPMIFIRQAGGNYTQTTLDDKDVPDLGFSQLANSWRAASWRPASNPVLVDGRLYLKSESRTVCCDAATGAVLWMGRPTRFPIDDWSRQLAQVAAHGVNVSFPTTTYMAGPQPRTMTEIMLFSDRLHHELSVVGGRVFAIEGELDTPSSRKKAAENATGTQMFGGQASRQQSRHNELACYDAVSGRLIWTASRGAGLPEGASLWSRPLAVGSMVLVATGTDTQLGLAAFDAETGVLSWKTMLAELGRAIPTIPVGLAVDDGSIYIASGAGNLFSVDRHGGALRWAVTYPRLKAAVLERRVVEGNAGQRVQIVLDENFIARDHGSLVLAASDSDHVMAFDITDGSLRWDSPVPPGVLSGSLGYVIGLANGRLSLANHKTLWSISTKGGRIMWDLPLEGSCGRGMLAGHSLLIPQQQSVTQIDQLTGHVVKATAVATPDSEPVGNLLANRDQVVVVSAARMISVRPKVQSPESAGESTKKTSPQGQP